MQGNSSVLMFESSALPPEDLPKRPTRIRTSTNTSKAAYQLPSSPSTTRTSIPRHYQSQELLARKARLSPEILSPTPRRHLIDSSASQQWMRTPPLSPMSSRAGSPTSLYSQSSVKVPRKKVLGHQHSFSSLLGQEHARPRDRVDTEATVSMARRWVRWMHKTGMKSWVVPVSLLGSTLVKACLSLGSYSGYNTPPLYGDYEAQRHWMELTIHLPIRQWYKYDLQYWGLDYPPLTAYVSWLCGMIGSWLNPSWFALDKSRGIETEESKIYMRTTVLVLDALVWIPALLLFIKAWQGTRSKRTQNVALLTLLFQPAMLLIDFGHFQYNSVMLGLSLLCLDFFAMGHDILGAICFVLSLGFKQMALYYAPAIGTYLIAKCLYLGPPQGWNLFVRLAATTVITFIVLFLPFHPPFAPLSSIVDPVTRTFPFARGLFEDKVANFWCATNVVFKWKRWSSPSVLVRLSAAFTALGFLPSVIVMLRSGYSHRLEQGKDAQKQRWTPFLPLLPYALLNSSMSFFLFSFQVHEKTILLPLMPLTLLLSSAYVDSSLFSWGVLVNNAAVFSLWPLLKRDGLGVQYIAILVLWNRLVGHNPFRLPSNSPLQLLSFGFYVVALTLHFAEWFITPPPRYPDLFPVLNVLVCTPVFALTWLWSIKRCVEEGWAIGGVRGNQLDDQAKPGKSDAAGGIASGATSGITGSFRQMGGRAVSLSASHARNRRAYESNRATSVQPAEPDM